MIIMKTLLQTLNTTVVQILHLNANQQTKDLQQWSINFLKTKQILQVFVQYLAKNLTVTQWKPHTMNGDIKIFSDSIPRGIGRYLNKFVRVGKPKLNVFQMLVLINCYIIWMLTYRIIMQNLTWIRNITCWC